MIIDVHAHAASEDFIRETASKPSYGMPYEVRPDGSYATRGYGEMDRLMWDLDGRLESLERRGIDLQLISPSPRTISDDKHVIGIEIARLMNRETANLVKRGGGRLAGMGVIPLGEPAKAADEIRRAVGEYGFQGVCMPRRRLASRSTCRYLRTYGGRWRNSGCLFSCMRRPRSRARHSASTPSTQ
jgi:aminocarboxymuconate-semialdehyde decarboxylase